MKPTLLILAAGIGSRYGGLKQIDPVGPHGEIIIDYSIFDAIRAGFKKVVFVIREDLEDAFRERFNKLGDQIEIAYSFQENELPEGFPSNVERSKPWGTGHAVYCAKDHISDPFAVINADDFYGHEAYSSIIDYFKNQQNKNEDLYHYAMVGYRLENTLSDYGNVSRGIGQVNGKGELLSVTERHGIHKEADKILFKDNDGALKEIQSNAVSMNFWAFDPSLFPELEKQFYDFLNKNINNPKAEFYIPSVVDQLIKEGKARVDVLKTGANWFGITYQEDKPVVRKQIMSLIDDGVYPSPLW